MAPTVTGTMIVEVRSRSATSPTTRIPTPTRNQASKPRSRSHIGAENTRESDVASIWTTVGAPSLVGTAAPLSDAPWPFENRSRKLNFTLAILSRPSDDREAATYFALLSSAPARGTVHPGEGRMETGCVAGVALSVDESLHTACLAVSAALSRRSGRLPERRPRLCVACRDLGDRRLLGALGGERPRPHGCEPVHRIRRPLLPGRRRASAPGRRAPLPGRPMPCSRAMVHPGERPGARNHARMSVLRSPRKESWRAALPPPKLGTKEARCQRRHTTRARDG